MCYRVYISTDSPADLTEHNSELVRFAKMTGPEIDTCVSILEFQNKWEVGSKSGCSCTFRHLHISSVELGFSDPQDWYTEEKDELDATRKLYQVLKEILAADYQVDLVDRWEGAAPEDITTLDVSLVEVAETAFRMFEDHKFRFTSH